MDYEGVFGLNFVSLQFILNSQFSTTLMISYLQVENLTKSFGDNLLFEKISFGISDNQRVALIAKNGTGKTTLLNIIAGTEDYQDGTISFRRLRFDCTRSPTCRIGPVNSTSYRRNRNLNFPSCHERHRSHLSGK